MPIPLVLALLLPLAAAAAPNPKVDEALWPALATGPQVVLVEVADPLGSSRMPTGETFDRARREPARREREADLSARKARVVGALGPRKALQVRQLFPSFRLMSLRAGEAEVRALAENPEVRRVYALRVHRKSLESSVPFTGAPRLHQDGFGGQGTTVAVLDSAVRFGNGFFGDCPQPGATGCKIAALVNFTADDPATVAFAEPHGTNVSGIVLGMAPQSQVISLNVFYFNQAANDYVSDSEKEVQALDWVAQNAAAYAIVAANLSLGSARNFPGPCNDDPLYDPFRTLWVDHNVLAAVASGNESKTNSVGEPACVTSAVSVAAQYDTQLTPWYGGCPSTTVLKPGLMACFSNVSGNIDLVAPGVDVDAAGVFHYTGTSMASPHVAGAIAALQSMAKAKTGQFASAAALHRQLLSTALPLPYRDNVYPQMHLVEEPRFRDAVDFPGWFREEHPANLIPGAPGLTVTTQVSGLGYAVAGLYLRLEVAHNTPQDVAVTLTSPDGKTASFKLPAGQADFNGVVGKLLSPGAFAGMVGSPADGTWTLNLVDGGRYKYGSLFSATLLFADPGCQASCSIETCGDDLCGGDCGACLIGGVCYSAGDLSPKSPCLSCQPGVSQRAFSPITGGPCTSTNLCALESHCETGRCVIDVMKDCREPDTCHENPFCDVTTGECKSVRRIAGSACDDGTNCTWDDHCVDGACVGKPASCPESECREHSTCPKELGLCLLGASKPDGTPCSSGTCKKGECSRCGCGSADGALLPALALLGMVLRRRRSGAFAK